MENQSIQNDGFLLFHEFPAQPHDQMMKELQVALGGGVYRHGLLKTYSPGFLRFRRLFNLVYIYTVSPFWLWRSQKSTVITVTVPPMIQVWLALWCFLLRTKLIVWLMDYHPEIEARFLDRHVCFRWIAHFLRWIDRMALRNVTLVIALDQAIAAAVRRQAPSTPVIVHPTWNTQSAEDRGQLVPPAIADEINLLYVGNLGFAHELKTLRRFAALAIEQGSPVKIVVVGGSASGNQRFSEMAKSVPLQLIVQPRVSLDQLKNLIATHRIAAGLVLLKPSSAGVVSPSKFSTYLNLGLPILYCGPPGTNADLVCRRFGAGLAISPNASDEVVAQAVHDWISEAGLEKRWTSVTAARGYFSQFNGQTLAAAITAGLADPQTVS